MSKPESWRPSDAAAKALADLLARTGKKKARLLDDLILAAARGPEILADNDQGSAATARARMHGALTQREIEDNERRLRQLNRSIGVQLVDPEKCAAFQRKPGMTVYDKRRR